MLYIFDFEYNIATHIIMTFLQQVHNFSSAMDK